MVARSPECIRGTECPEQGWQTGFMALLPEVRRHARAGFGALPAEARAEAVQEVVAVALVMYLRLVQTDRTSLAFASVLARFGVARVREGRRAAGTSSRDVFSRQAQRRHGFAVGPLCEPAPGKAGWQEILVEDRRATPAEIAASRLDFAAWLERLSPKRRSVVELLGDGASTGETAQRTGVSSGRISQLRRERYDDWQQFVGDRALKA